MEWNELVCESGSRRIDRVKGKEEKEKGKGESGSHRERERGRKREFSPFFNHLCYAMV